MATTDDARGRRRTRAPFRAGPGCARCDRRRQRDGAARRHHRQRRAPAHWRRLRRGGERAAVGAHGLPARARVAHPPGRSARRPLRSAACLRRRHRVVRGRVVAVRCGAQPRSAGRRARLAGCRRRAAHAREPRDPAGELPPRRPRRRGRGVVGPRRSGRCDRSLRRRVAGRRAGLALGLPPERSRRAVGRRVHARGRAGITRSLFRARGSISSAARSRSRASARRRGP